MAKSKSKTVYVCQSCGAQKSRWEGRCADCGEWNTMLEEKAFTEPQTRGLSSRVRAGGATAGSGALSARNQAWSTGGSQVGAIPLSKSLSAEFEAGEGKNKNRIDTSLEELNRVLGGGLVRGSFILVGGDPGIGKSTLLLQVAGGLAKVGRKVLYVSGEESVEQTSLRASRLGLEKDDAAADLVQIMAESQMETIRETALELQPDVLVVDSIQTVFLGEIDSAPGSVTQVRECAATLMALAKGHGIAVFVVGHVTKDGQIAGPKVLEHMVDTVLSFEGDKTQTFRLLRALKNRFGATHELGVFAMDSAGLREVKNPSELFLEERGENLLGSSVHCSIEGSRPLLCEVQALTISSAMAMPRRTSIGFDTNRVHLLAAILNRHLGLKLAQSDLFINVVGGLRLEEPAADFAVAAALISTETEREIPAKTCFFGELGLTGETRAVPFADARIKEAIKLGFTRFVVPSSNKRQIDPVLKASAVRGLSVHFVKSVVELAETIVDETRPRPKPGKPAEHMGV